MRNGLEIDNCERSPCIFTRIFDSCTFVTEIQLRTRVHYCRVYFRVPSWIRVSCEPGYMSVYVCLAAECLGTKLFSFSRSAVVVFPNAVFVVIFDVFALDHFRRSCPLYSFRFEGPESGKRGDWGGRKYCYVGRCSRFRFDITFASNEGVNFIRTAFCEFTTMSKIFL